MTIATMRSDDARTKFRELLDTAMMGGEIVIERYGKPIAVVINYEQWQQWRRAQLAEKAIEEN